MRSRILLTVAIALGLAIAWVDSRPNWDDTGVTAGMLVMCGAILGFAGPRQAWRWAIALGVWIPLNAIVRTRLLSAFAMLIIVAFPMAGAYAGAFIRRTFTRLPKWISTT